MPTSRDPRAVATYVETMTAELARLAREHGLPTLAYILDMARLEARNAMAEDGGSRSPAGEA